MRLSPVTSHYFAIMYFLFRVGHGSVIQAIDGEYWYFYHSWRFKELNKNPPGRVLLLDKIHWDILPDGPWPYVGVPSDTALPAPMT